MRDIFDQLIKILQDRLGWRPVLELLIFTAVVSGSVFVVSHETTEPQVLAVLICIAFGSSYFWLTYGKSLRKWVSRLLAVISVILVLAVGFAINRYATGGHRRITKLLDGAKALEQHGMYIDAIAKLSGAVSAAHDLGDGQTEAKALCERGLYELFAGQTEASANSYQSCASLAITINDFTMEGNGRVGLGQVHQRQGQSDWARRDYMQALDTYVQAKGDEHENESGEADAHVGLAIIATNQHNFSEGRDEFSLASSLYRKSGKADRQGNVLEYLGQLEVSAGDIPSARRDYNDALDVFKKSGDRRSQANVLEDLAFLEGAASDDAKARQDFADARGLFQQLNSLSGEAGTLSGLGDLDRKVKRPESARDNYLQALGLYERTKDNPGRANILLNLGLCEGLLSHFDKASEYFASSRQLFHELGNQNGEAQAYFWGAWLLVQTGDKSTAAPMFQQAQTLANEAGNQSLAQDATQQLQALSVHVN